MDRMMDCQDIAALLSALVDDEIDPETRHDAERHVSGCDACRRMLDEAETLDDLVRADVLGDVEATTLPASFIDAVLGQTVHASSGRIRPASRWTSYSGWLAAAASLGLAITIWVVDRRPGDDVGGPGEDRLAAVAPADGTSTNVVLTRAPSFVNARPWVDDSVVLDPAPVAAAAPTPVESVPSPAPSVLSAGMLPQLTPEARPVPAVAAATLTDDDEAVLATTASMMELLLESDLASFEDLEFIRRTASYNELVDRLVDVRSRVGESDRDAIMTAESVLFRIVEGPIDLRDARDLQQAVRRFALPARLDRLSGRYAAWSTAM